MYIYLYTCIYAACGFSLDVFVGIIVSLSHYTNLRAVQCFGVWKRQTQQQTSTKSCVEISMLQRVARTTKYDSDCDSLGFAEKY